VSRTGFRPVLEKRNTELIFEVAIWRLNGGCEREAAPPRVYVFLQRRRRSNASGELIFADQLPFWPDEPSARNSSDNFLPLDDSSAKGISPHFALVALSETDWFVATPSCS